MRYSRRNKNFPSPKKQRKGQHCWWLLVQSFIELDKNLFSHLSQQIFSARKQTFPFGIFTVVAQHQHKRKSISWRWALLLWFVRSPSTCKHVWIGMLIKISSNFIGQYKQEFQFLYFFSDWIQIKEFFCVVRVRRARSFRLMVEFLNWSGFFIFWKCLKRSFLLVECRNFKRFFADDVSIAAIWLAHFSTEQATTIIINGAQFNDVTNVPWIFMNLTSLRTPVELAVQQFMTKLIERLRRSSRH